MSTTFLVNVMLLQSNLMFLHTKVVFSCFGYQILQGFSTVHLAKIDPLLFTCTFRCFFFFNWLIQDCEILPICNSLLICKRVEEKNYKKGKQERSISIAISIKAMLLSKHGGHKVDK